MPSDPLTPERLAEIEEAEREATPAPWQWAPGFGPLCGPDEDPLLEGLSGGRVSVSENDARLIALARNALPSLCASLRAAWAERDAALSDLANARGAWVALSVEVSRLRAPEDAAFEAKLREHEALKARVEAALRGDRER
jgi:hypothetical protein